MDNINVTPQFCLAGEATFTVSNGTDHYTYHVYKKEPSGRYTRPVYFAKVLVAPDTYKYIGMLVDGVPQIGSAIPHVKITTESKFRANSTPVQVLNWALRVIWQVEYGTYVLPPTHSIKHDGKCGRCGAKLTHPASLDTGLGPGCAELAGVEWKEHSTRRQPGLYGAQRELNDIGGLASYDDLVTNNTAHPGHPSNRG